MQRKLEPCESPLPEPKTAGSAVSWEVGQLHQGVVVAPMTVTRAPVAGGLSVFKLEPKAADNAEPRITPNCHLIRVEVGELG